MDETAKEKIKYIPREKWETYMCNTTHTQQIRESKTEKKLNLNLNAFCCRRQKRIKS